MLNERSFRSPYRTQSRNGVRPLRWLVVLLVLASACLPVDARVLLKPKGANAMPLFTRSISADVVIDGQFATTTLTLVFQNDCSDQIEADFIYTLPPGAVATYFAYWAEEEKVVARIVEKKRAAAIYQRITSWRRDPALIELVGKNVFRARISPVFPNADLRVELRIVQALPSDAGGVLYSLPIADPTQPDPLDSIDVKIRVRADPAIDKVTDNYGLPVTSGPEGYSLSLSGELYRPPKDLNVRIVPKPKPMHVSLYAAPSGGPDGFFALSLTPDHSITSPTLTISGIKTFQLVPARLPSVKAHHPITLCGRYKGSGVATVTLEGTSPSGRVRYCEKAQFGCEPEPNNLATKFWAAGRIEQLSAMRDCRGHVIELSKRFTLPSKFTSWLAVPKAEMIDVKRQEYGPKLNALGQRLADLIEAGKENSPEAQSVRKQFDEVCAQIGVEPNVELREHLRGTMSRLCSQLADLIADGTDSEAEGRAVRQELEDRFGLTGDDLRDEMSYYLRSHASDAASDLIAEQRRAQPDEARISALQGRLQRTASAADLDAEHLIKQETPQFDSYRPHRIARMLAKLVAEGKAEEAEAKALREELAEAAKKRGATPKDYLRHEYDRYIAGPARKLVNLVKEGKDASPEAREMREQIEVHCRRTGTTVRECVGSYLYDAPWDIGSSIARATMDGKESSELRRRLAKLCELGGLDERRQLRNSADVESAPAFDELNQELHSPKKNPARIASLKKQLRRIEPLMSKPLSTRLQEYEYHWRSNRVWYVAHQLVDLMAQGQSSSKAGRALRRDLDSLSKKGPGQGRPHTLMLDLIEGKMQDLAGEVVRESHGASPDQARIAERKSRMTRLERISKISAREYLESAEGSALDDELWSARDRLDSEIEREKPNEPRLKRLREDHGRLVREAKAGGDEDKEAVTYDEGIDEVIDLRLQSSKLASEIAAAKTSGEAAKAGDLEKRKEQIDADFNKRWHKLNTRWGGDPLISVEAPADALQVVALMPDGEVKTLVYNAESARWEARFDTPIYAPEGDYVITIIVVLKDGTRKQLTLRYRIDTTPPKGAGTSVMLDNKLRLEIDADEDTARVAALLPWGELVRMRKSAEPGRFSVTVPVPDEFAGKSVAVTFILTDSAHNRTAIALDTSQ